jgi:hypothetical protein
MTDILGIESLLAEVGLALDQLLSMRTLWPLRRSSTS